MGKAWAGNLTSHATGIGGRSDAEVALAIRSGLRFDGRPMAPPMSFLVPHLAYLTDSDLSALIAFLRTLPPVDRSVPPRELEPAAAVLYGE